MGFTSYEPRPKFISLFSRRAYVSLTRFLASSCFASIRKFHKFLGFPGWVGEVKMGMVAKLAKI